MDCCAAVEGLFLGYCGVVLRRECEWREYVRRDVREDALPPGPPFATRSYRTCGFAIFLEIGMLCHVTMSDDTMAVLQCCER